MLRKTVIVLAKVAVLTSGLTVLRRAVAERNRGPRCGWLRVSWLQRHRKPPPGSTAGCSRWDKYEPRSEASSFFG